MAQIKVLSRAEIHSDQGTSQCNSSLESGGATLQDGMARSDFQWPGKPQGEIRSFSKVKRLINQLK
jgi:hypothetical protein